MNHYYVKPLSVKVEDGRLIIEIGTATLAHAVSYSDWANPYDDQRSDYIRTFAITDHEEFAKDVGHAMLREQEDGSSPLSNFLDKVSSDAVDDGSIACECDQLIKHGEHAASETWAAPSAARPKEPDHG